MTDPISDMLSRIRNAIMAKKEEVVFPYSKIKFGICKILEKEKLIQGVEIFQPPKVTYRKKAKNNYFRQIKVILKYDENKQPIITNLKRVSKPGRRIYVKHNEIPKVLDGYGMAILSTTLGLMSDKEARKKKIGGELICEIY
ncbi:MAG: 30S ribosomal protein S8 [Patescibacteria group bacterium]